MCMPTLHSSASRPFILYQPSPQKFKTHYSLTSIFTSSKDPYIIYISHDRNYQLFVRFFNIS